jgi:hypothetical protein
LTWRAFKQLSTEGHDLGEAGKALIRRGKMWVIARHYTLRQAVPFRMLAPMIDLWRQTDVPQIAATLATRPGHESTRTLVATILRSAFHADGAALDHEVGLPELR